MAGISIRYGKYKYWRAQDGINSKYFKRADHGRIIYLHRQVYADNFGAIPESHEVHHIDGDTHNNTPENLTTYTRRDHKKEHRGTCSEAQRAHIERNMPRFLAGSAAWRATKEGQEKMVENSRLAYKNRKPIAKVCEVCGSGFDDITRRESSRFCSNACKSKYRRDNCLDNIEKDCPICGKKFQSNRYKSVVTCSRGCANTFRARK